MSIAMNPMNAATALTNPIGSLRTPALAPDTAAGSTGGASSPFSDSPFSDLLTDAVGQVNQIESKARSAVEGLMTGSGDGGHRGQRSHGATRDEEGRGSVAATFAR